MTIRAMLFDLDNTLYPASSGIMQHLDRRIGEYVEQRLGLTEAEALQARRDFYTTYGTTLRGLQRHYRDVETEDYLQFVHNVAIEELLQLDEKLDAALARLPARKVIFTNSPREHAERVLKTLGITHHFERIFDLRYFNFVGKPDPQCYQHILDQLGIEGTEALLVEDTPHNLPPAKELGMTTILICDEPTPCPTADYIVPDVLTALDVAEPLLTPRVTRMPVQPATAKIPLKRRRSA